MLSINATFLSASDVLPTSYTASLGLIFLVKQILWLMRLRVLASNLANFLHCISCPAVASRTLLFDVLGLVVLGVTPSDPIALLY